MSIQSHTELKKIVYLSVFIALAIILNWIESPVFTFIPGPKLGLANISTVLVLYLFGPIESIVVAFFRIIIGAILKGTLHPIPFFTSFFGGLTGAIMMAVTYKLFRNKFSIMGISTIGGLTNNLAQFFVVLYITKNYAFWAYLPVLLIIGGVSGWIIGAISNLVYNRLEKEKGRLNGG
jgi:heptaprenyl diphosphate synthase